MEGDFQSEIFFAHLPYRSRNSIGIKKRLGLNRISAKFDAETGWQNQMLIKLDEQELDELWQRNSFKINSDGIAGLVIGSDPLKFDQRLTTAIKKVLDNFDYERWLRVVNCAKKVGNSQSELKAPTSLVFDVLGSHIRELNSCYTSEIHIALAERDKAVAERDKAVAERDSVLKSTIWKITKPYRKLRNLF
jgi:hypothetical protein